MSRLRWIPYTLIIAWLFSGIFLAFAVSTSSVNIVQSMYVAVILILIAATIANIATSFAVLVGRFHGYWSSGFPDLLGFTLLAWGLFKSTGSTSSLTLIGASVAIGYFIGRWVPDRLSHILPLFTVAALHVFSELTITRDEIPPLINVLCSGLVLATIMKKRSPQQTDVAAHG